MLIREEEPRDHEQVRLVHEAAFGEHGRVLVAPLVDTLRSRLSNEPGLSLVTVDGDQVVAHAMFTQSLLDAPARLVEVQVLSPVAVRPDRQRRGVGSELIRRGLDLLSRRGVPLVFLEGDPRYYSRFGFRPAADHGFRKPSLRIPDAGFQVRLLPAYEPWMTGTLVYSEPFWAHDAVGLRDG